MGISYIDHIQDSAYFWYGHNYLELLSLLGANEHKLMILDPLDTS